MGLLVYFTENLELKDSVTKNKSRKHSWSTRKTVIDNSYIESIKAWANQITGESYIAKVGSKGLLELNDFARDFAKVCLR